MRFPWCKML